MREGEGGTWEVEKVTGQRDGFGRWRAARRVAMAAARAKDTGAIVDEALG